MSEKLCCRCRVRPVATPRNPYCKPCRAAYQRAWRARRKGALDLPPDPGPIRAMRLRGRPTPAELVRYRLI